MESIAGESVTEIIMTFTAASLLVVRYQCCGPDVGERKREEKIRVSRTFYVEFALYGTISVDGYEPTFNKND